MSYYCVYDTLSHYCVWCLIDISVYVSIEVLDYTKLIGVSEPNLGNKVSFGKKGAGGAKVFKTFGIGGCEGQM